MNEEDGQIEEKPSDKKGGDTHSPVSAVGTAKSSHNGSERADQRKESTTLEQISRWDRTKEWFCKITVAELGMFLLTLVIAGSSIYYTKYAKRQWKAMRDQLGQMIQQSTTAQNQLTLMDKQFAMSHRPWLGMAGLGTFARPLTFDSVGAHADVIFSVKNGGSSPALGIFQQVDLLISSNRTMLSDVDAKIQRNCSPQYVGQTIKMNIRIPLILPGDTLGIQNPTSISAGRKTFPDNPKDLVHASIVFTLIYEDDLGKPHCSAIVQAYRTTDGRLQFEPNGIVKGELSYTGFGRVY